MTEQSRRSRRRTAAAVLAALALPLLGGCSSDNPAPPAASTTASSTAAATATVDYGPVVPVTVPADRAPADLSPGSRVQIVGLDQDRWGTRFAMVAAVRPHGPGHLTVDLAPGDYDPDLGVALLNPPAALSIIQIDAPAGDPS